MADHRFCGRDAFSADRTVALLARQGPPAKPLAGDQGLYARMTLLLARPGVMTGLADPAGLSYIRMTGGELRIGALTRHADLLASAVAVEHFAILRDVRRIIAGRFVRCSQTVGGMLCQADPSEDLAAVLAAVDARMVIQGGAGTRIVPARRFHLGPYATVVEPGELLTEIRLPAGPGGGAYEKAHRPTGDCPATGAAAVIWLAGGEVARARVELMAAPAQHYGAVQAEDFLARAPATPASFEQAGEIAAAHCACSSARRGPADSATCIASVLTARALGRACLRAGGQDGTVRDPA